MRSLHDTSAIQRLIAQARLRIRTQWALEGAATATVLASAIALAVIFAIRTGAVGTPTGIALIVGAGLLIVIGAVVSALRPLDDETVARRIDRASNLSDRLSTAIAFRRTMATAGSAPTPDDETADLMIAAIRDGVKAVPRANIRAATPFASPKDLRAAAGFLVVSALAAGLALPTVDRSPRLSHADPDHAPPGAEVTLHGDNLMMGVAAPVARLGGNARHVLGAPNVPAEATAPPIQTSGFVPEGTSVYLGQAAKARPVVILDWTRESIRIRIPADAPIGDTVLTAHIGSRTVGPVAFTVVDPKDARFHNAEAVTLDPDERAYVEAILGELKRIAQRDNIEDLDKFAKTIEQLLKDAEEGKITKEQLLEALQKAEDLMNQGAEPDQAELAKQMAEMGKELSKNEQTKELGEALKQNNLEKAKQELEKIANKLDPKGLEQEKQELEKKLEQDKSLSEQDKQDLQKKLEELKKQQAENDKKPMTEKQKQELAKKLDDVSKQMEKQQKDQKQKLDQQQQKLEEQVRRLQKEKEQAKTEQQKLDAERRLQKAKDELKKLEKKEDEKNQSAQREAVKRLQKDLEKAAEQLQKPKDKQENEEEQEEREKQASQKIKDAARETGRVDQDQRKQATQKKMSSQMDDLREAMRRAKQKGNKGPQDPFGKNGKNKDFQARARGKKGSGQAWKPGQPGQGQPGQGQGNQPGGPGQGQGGDSWGTGHDPNLTDDPTDKGGHTKDQDLQGKAGSQGGSTRQTILAAAQKGFASKRYQEVYADYQRIVEEVMRTEKLPSSYKYYVKRYFAKIHPSGAPAGDDAAPTTVPAPPAPKANP